MPIWNRQPKRSVPEPVKPPQHGAVNPLREDTSDLDSYRQRILGITVALIGLGVLGFAVYGPWFTVRSVRVSGTREIAPASVQRVTEHYLAQWRFGLWPNNNLWLLSRTYLSGALEKKIRERISIEEVRIIKKNRHDLEVIVVERSPIALWKSGERQGTIDRTGTVINLVTTTSPLPIISDLGEKPFVIGQQIVTEPVMRGWSILNDAFKESTLAVEQYLIPVPTCPTTIITPEQQAEANRNVNSSTTPDPTNSGLNSNSRERSTLNANSELNSNENRNGNDNTNTFEPIVVQTDCDLVALAKASQELHVKLKDGPLVLFDRHQDLALAVQTVKRLLTNPDNSGAGYIDIRFQERVYIK